MKGDERGLVLEIQGQEVIVLTPGGEFRRVKAPQPFPKVGEEIMLPPTSSWMWSRVRLTFAVAALIFLAFGLARIFGPGGLAIEKPSLYVAVDINPSLELALNKEERVVEANSLNTEGKVLLEGLNLRGQHVQDAIRIISKAALEKGYLHPGEEGFLIISVVAEEETEEEIEALDQLAGNLAKAAEEVLQAKHVKAIVKANTFEVELRKQAAKLGLSPGKYALYLKALEAGIPVTVEELREQGALKALRRAGLDPRNLLDSVLPGARGKGKQSLAPVNSEEGIRGVQGENKEKPLPPEGRTEKKLPEGIPSGEGGAQDIEGAEEKIERGKGSREAPKAVGPSQGQEGLDSPRGIKGGNVYPSKDTTIPGRLEESKGGEGRKGGK